MCVFYTLWMVSLCARVFCTLNPALKRSTKHTIKMKKPNETKRKWKKNRWKLNHNINTRTRTTFQFETWTNRSHQSKQIKYYYWPTYGSLTSLRHGQCRCITHRCDQYVITIEWYREHGDDRFSEIQNTQLTVECLTLDWTPDTMYRLRRRHCRSKMRRRDVAVSTGIDTKVNWLLSIVMWLGRWRRWSCDNLNREIVQPKNVNKLNGRVLWWTRFRKTLLIRVYQCYYRRVFAAQLKSIRMARASVCVCVSTEITCAAKLNANRSVCVRSMCVRSSENQLKIESHAKCLHAHFWQHRAQLLYFVRFLFEVWPLFSLRFDSIKLFAFNVFRARSAPISRRCVCCTYTRLACIGCEWDSSEPINWAVNHSRTHRDSIAKWRTSRNWTALDITVEPLAQPIPLRLLQIDRFLSSLCCVLKCTAINAGGPEANGSNENEIDHKLPCSILWRDSSFADRWMLSSRRFSGVHHILPKCAHTITKTKKHFFLCRESEKLTQKGSNRCGAFNSYGKLCTRMFCVVACHNLRLENLSKICSTFRRCHKTHRTRGRARCLPCFN